MGTKSTRSSGTQFNPRGATQGNTLVDPNTGLPITVVTETDGSRRLAVDANLSADEVVVETRPLDASTDDVAIRNPTTDVPLLINPDGSIDVNTAITAVADNITIVGTEDGTIGGTKHAIRTLADGTVVTVAAGATASTPQIFNVSVPLANTEVSQALPANTKRFFVKVRNSTARLQLAFTSGNSGTNYISLTRGTGYEESDLDVAALTLYFQTNSPGQIVEILAWS